MNKASSAIENSQGQIFLRNATGLTREVSLLGDCWLPVIKSVREHLVVSDVDLNLLRFASGPEEAVQEIRAGLRDNKWIGSGPHG